MAKPSREDQYAVTVSVGGVSYGTFDKLSGGEMDSEEVKYRPGGMGSEVALGGPRTTSNVTVSRIYDLERDQNQLASLKAGIGKSAVTITKQPLDVDGNSFGLSATVYTGVLKNVKLPDHDSTSNNPGMIELEVSTNAVVS